MLNLHHEASPQSLTPNFAPLLNSPKPTRALLSIRPEFAHAIFTGKKKFEFRRNYFAREVDIVVVYVSAPIKLVLGEFDLAGYVHTTIEALWEQTKHYGGISRDRFFAYFSGLEKGYALQIGDVRQYESPTLIQALGVRPPQSFVYL